MPETDPLSMIAANINASFGEKSGNANNIFTTFNQGMTALNQSLFSGLAEGFKGFNEVAPHNVLAKVMAAGQGTFSAKMTTSEINKMNIY
jgi:hypothetical protein